MNWTEDSAHFAASGLAFQKGLERFDELMPKERAAKLYRACYEHYGHKWVQKKFITYLLHVVWREETAPTCSSNCGYRMKYDATPLQQNALRVEIFTPSDRCSAKLKFDRIGGRPDDYHPCNFCESQNNKNELQASL